MFSFPTIFNLFLFFPSLILAIPFGTRRSLSTANSSTAGTYELPILRRTQSGASGSTGLGNIADLLYSVPREDRLGHDIPSSRDLWVVTDTCKSDVCEAGASTTLPSASLKPIGANVTMRYGDSKTGTYASGLIGKDTVTVAGIAMTDQHFAAIENTTNPTVRFGAAGIFGLGFPSTSSIQHAAVNQQFGSPEETDDFVFGTYLDGPLLSRISMTNQLAAPMFTITLQRNTIDIGGQGLLTVGKLPDGIDNSSLTWVPVRRYSHEEGGLKAPRFAPDEVFPSRWEIDIGGVFLDGRRLPDSEVPVKAPASGRVSALIDTGNSLIRGPSDVVHNILRQVSPTFAASNDPQADAVLPCSIPRTLAFEIGGKKFPVDPRDFIGQYKKNSVDNCVADNLVSTDAPSRGSLYRWSLGDPFLRSNLVAFHYGNLTHPSVDPPRIGFLSLVPQNISEVFAQAVQDARNSGGNFESTYDLAPTATAGVPVTTVSPSTPAFITDLSALTTLRLAVPSAMPSSSQRNAGYLLAPLVSRIFFASSIALFLL
ncbi:hypothetical protein ONZ45_g19278 [Pleurotus djamor]|nr:hypothetical protein ONZ45_g19278 [Pleurotus djamor]